MKMCYYGQPLTHIFTMLLSTNTALYMCTRNETNKIENSKQERTNWLTVLRKCVLNSAGSLYIYFKLLHGTLWLESKICRLKSKTC